MKKIIPLVLIFVLLTGCKIKNYTPEIVDFNQNATFTSGEFSCQCNVTYENGTVTVAATSTNVSGVTYIYNGSSLICTYDDMEYTQNSGFEASNPAVALYDAFEYLKNVENVDVSLTDTGFEYKGKTALGDFVLLQKKDNCYISINFVDYGVKFDFIQ